MKKKQKQVMWKWVMNALAIGVTTSAIWFASINGSDVVVAAAIGTGLLVMLVYAEGTLWIQKTEWIKSARKKRVMSHHRLSSDLVWNKKRLDKEIRRIEKKIDQLKEKSVRKSS